MFYFLPVLLVYTLRGVIQRDFLVIDAHPHSDDAESNRFQGTQADSAPILSTSTTTGSLWMRGLFGRQTWNWCPVPGVGGCGNGHCCSDAYMMCCRVACCGLPNTCRMFAQPPPTECCVPGQNCGPLLDSGGGDSKGVDTPRSGNSDSDDDDDDGLSKSDRIALGVSIGLGLPGAIVAMAAIWRWCSR
ncbi:hypothetical protein CC2G_004866 [Coprinopsis cinerea AmutBmut pab1-1]|nr:hypothetical protein CC2G_004866 [Coprinopsis cinerea AmutBmut pab1-1]